MKNVFYRLRDSGLLEREFLERRVSCGVAQEGSSSNSTKSRHFGTFTVQGKCRVLAATERLPHFGRESSWITVTVTFRPSQGSDPDP